MKKQLPAIIVLLAITLSTAAQPSIPLPKHIIAQPQANVKLLELNDIISGRWRGARITQLPGAVNVDSVWLEIKKNGTLSFKHQQYEFNGPTEGTYTITKNKIVISFIKFPFTHTLNGEWDIKTGTISGNYIELKEKDSNQPSYYVPGRNTGTFNLIKY
jgi:hypothetical protein